MEDIFCIYGDVQAAMNSGARSRGGFTQVGSVAIVDIVGTLSRGESWWTGTSYGAVINAMQQAGQDPDIGSVLLMINSPGGSTAGVDDAAQAIRATARRKPVTAYIEDVGASAAYYLASQAGKIYAARTALIGSVGVYAVVRDYSQLEKRIGIKSYVIRTGPLKGAGALGDEITPEQLAEFQRRVDGFNDFFITAVANGRGIQAPFVREHIATGAAWYAADAHRLHLIDGISDFGSVFASLRGVRPPSEIQAAIPQAAAPAASSPPPPPTRPGKAMSIAKQQFEEEVQKHIDAGMSREKAHAKVCRENPELRQAMVEEHNEDHRRKRM